MRRSGLLAVGLAVAVSAAAATVQAQVPAAAGHETHRVAGLAKPAEILVDTWGIAHVYAGSVRDAYFLQGYNAARDRLWQIDLWRKRGLGLLARDFGPDYVAQDRAARLFLYRGDMAAEWAAYGPDAKPQAEAFVAGVNAYVDEIAAGARPLPTEFAIARTRPDHWSAADVVRIRSHGLTRNLASEVERAQVACKAGLGADRLRRRLQPDWTTTVPPGLDPCAVPAAVMRDYALATGEVRFKGAAQTAGVPDMRAMDGSNAWVISPARTATGRPMLASDPHRAVGVPSLRYIVHLQAPGLDVIGAGEPALPGVSIGHNDQIAFGLTIFAMDQEDLYVYELDPASPDRYRYGSGFEAMTVVRETIPVKGEADRPVELRYTRHGPVLLQDAAKGRAFALRSVWAEPGAAAYVGSSRYMTATSWPQFKAAVADWKTPSENLLFASRAGDIGWQVVGASPIRPGWDGLLPAPGDGRYEWQGFAPSAALPASHNPAKGFFASANEMNLPTDPATAALKLGYEWADDSRIRRLNQVLAANGKVTLEDSVALQADVFSSTAVRYQALLAPLTSTDPTTAEALALLRTWDARVTADSAAAALFEIWTWRRLGFAAAARLTPEAARPLVGKGSVDAVLTWLETDATPADREAVMLTSLKAAMLETRERLGPDATGWKWGALHKAKFQHPLSPLADPQMREKMQAGPAPIGGGTTTPRLAPYDDNFVQYHGASFKMVVDVGAWDRSVAINSPGQSGDPLSPHYKDMFTAWAEGRQTPLLYSRAAVERATALVIKLEPSR